MTSGKAVKNMLLYLVQHGEAKKEEEDPARGLTPKGTEDVRRTAACGRSINLRVGRIFHSGKARALQTARILEEVLKPSHESSEAGGLAPLDDPGVWAGRLAGMHEDVMLIGHLPHLGRLAGLLVCGDGEKSPVTFQMGGIVCLKRADDGRWSILRMIAPDTAAACC